MTDDELIKLIDERITLARSAPPTTPTKRPATDADAEYFRAMMTRAQATHDTANSAAMLIGMLRARDVSITPAQLGTAISELVRRSLRAEDLGPYLPPACWA